MAPFFGAVLFIALLHEHLSARLLIAGALMAVGLWLHLTESRIHKHAHVAMDHELR
jgi:drug/metabolite transporter (DMT)-like permease